MLSCLVISLLFSSFECETSLGAIWVKLGKGIFVLEWVSLLLVALGLLDGAKDGLDGVG